MRALTVILSQDALTLEGLTRSEAEGLLAGLMPQGGTREVKCARPLPEQEVPLPRAAPCPPSTALLRVARLYHGSVTDGPGRRSVLAVQGCPLRCPGCYVPETHDPRGGVALPVTQLRDLLLAADGAPRDGISVVGGEPFAQPEAVHALLQLCRPRVPHITVYSGYTLAALRRRTEPAVRGILGLIDLLIDGPYVAALAGGAGEWRGSGNQRLHGRRALQRVLGGS